MHSMAIKINVSKKDQESLSKTLEAVGYSHQSRKFHCTIGFIEHAIPKEDVHSFGDRVTQLLQEHISEQHPLFQVGVTEHVFGRAIAFLPNEESKIQLSRLNQWLHSKVLDLSEGQFDLNPQTQPEGFTPHMTLWHTRQVDPRFEALKKWQVEQKPSYTLSQAAYVVF